MSADPYDVAPAGASPLAQPTVDVLPAVVGRRTRGAEPAAEPSPAPFQPYAEPAPTDALWGAPGAEVSDPYAPGAPVPPAATRYPLAAVDPTASVAYPVEGMDAGPVEPAGPPAKKFLGMQLRRPKKVDEDPAVPVEQPVGWAPPVPAEPGIPVAAWPTDVTVPVVAGSEAQPAWGPLMHTDAPDAPPVEAPHAPIALAEPVAVEPAAVEPVAVEPVAVEPVAGDELRALRALLDASEAGRVAAEQRADQAVQYAQQVQAELSALRTDAQAKLAAAETKARTAANEAQDWQIRHREAETQIAELVASVSGAEGRLAEMRAERDDLMAALEEATSPESVDAPAEPAP
jgi:nicotinate-nucleotide--dimethylbenzimidazole phosphoribosyltransferase